MLIIWGINLKFINENNNSAGVLLKYIMWLLRLMHIYLVLHNYIHTQFPPYMITCYITSDYHLHCFLLIHDDFPHAMHNPESSWSSLQYSFPGNQSRVFNLASYELDPDCLCMNNNDTSVPDSTLLCPHIAALLKAAGLSTWYVWSWTYLLITVGRSGRRRRGSLAASPA